MNQVAEIEYIPTPEEIEAGCAAIRAGWSDADFTRRRRGDDLKEYSLAPEVIGEAERFIESKLWMEREALGFAKWNCRHE
ncbi:MAG: hypothetical protein Q8M16_11870 [Pirellulaceae bacterium]|nr:hypothetical protein [Pirellulaceae bacterium]